MYICLSDYKTFPSHTNVLDILNFTSLIIITRFFTTRKEKKNMRGLVLILNVGTDKWLLRQRGWRGDKNTLSPAEVILPGSRLKGVFVYH